MECLDPRSLIGKLATPKNEVLQLKITASKSMASVKSSIHLKLGAFQAARIPLSCMIMSSGFLYWATHSWSRDPRNNGLPAIGNTVTYFLTAGLYILFSLVWGPTWMQNREPIKPKKIMMLYNLFQVVLCTYMFFEAGLAGWFYDYDWKCQQEDRSVRPQTLRMVNVVYLYYLSKILDFTDTMFMVLGKKWSSLSLLHVLHHSIMYICAWHAIYYKPAGHLNFAVFVNSGIHAIMYFYYFLATLGPSIQPYLWWKKYLTTIQIIQFVGVFLHTTQVFFRDCPDVSNIFAIFTCGYAVIFTLLFTDFFKEEYKTKKTLYARE